MKKENLHAIRKSIKHWMLEIRKPLMGGEKISVTGFKPVWASTALRVKCFDVNCELCVKVNGHCSFCPLAITTGKKCGIDSPYTSFRNIPCLTTATDMVRALVCTYWAERNGEND